jgi:hypothetical protein
MYMHINYLEEAFTPSLPFLCASLRRASPALTSLYDEALRPLELRATQFTVLQSAYPSFNDGTSRSPVYGPGRRRLIFN